MSRRPTAFRARVGDLVVFFVDGTLLSATCVTVARVIDDDALELESKHGLVICTRADKSPRAPLTWDFLA